jgi:hypothetical protein
MSARVRIIAFVAAAAAAIFVLWLVVLGSGWVGQPGDRIPAHLRATFAGLEEAVTDQRRIIDLERSVFADARGYLENLKRVAAQPIAGDRSTLDEAARLGDTLLAVVARLESVNVGHGASVELWLDVAKSIRRGARGSEVDGKLGNILKGTDLTAKMTGLSRIDLRFVAQSIALDIPRFDAPSARKVLADLSRIQDILIGACDTEDGVRANLETATRTLIVFNAKAS